MSIPSLCDVYYALHSTGADFAAKTIEVVGVGHQLHRWISNASSKRLQASISATSDCWLCEARKLQPGP